MPCSANQAPMSPAPRPSPHLRHPTPAGNCINRSWQLCSHTTPAITIKNSTPLPACPQPALGRLAASRRLRGACILLPAAAVLPAWMLLAGKYGACCPGWAPLLHPAHPRAGWFQSALLRGARSLMMQCCMPPVSSGLDAGAAGPINLPGFLLIGDKTVRHWGFPGDSSAQY